jgi:hypothetical protein
MRLWFSSTPVERRSLASSRLWLIPCRISVHSGRMRLTNHQNTVAVMKPTRNEKGSKLKDGIEKISL